MAAQRRRLNSVPDRPGRVVLYARVSAVMDRGGEEFHSPDIQVDAMRSMVASMGLREVLPTDGRRILDIDVSGRTFKRDGLDVVLKMARAKQIDVVAVYDLSRLGRNLRESLNLIAELRKLGVHIVSTRERIDDSPQGRFMLGQFLGLAELYSDQVGDSWAASIHRRARDGHHHGRPPRGYTRSNDKVLDSGRVRKTGPLTVDPKIAPYITKSFERHANGDRLADIVRSYQDVTGQRISLQTMKRLLANRAYLGKVLVNGVEFDGTHPALVDQDIFDRCQARLNRDRFVPSRTLQIVHSLAGMLVCDNCGLSWSIKRRRDGMDPGPFYKHMTAIESGDKVGADGEVCIRGGTPRVSHVEAEVVRQVLERISLLVSDSSARTARATRIAQRAAELPRLERELVEVQAAIARLTVQLAHETVTEQAYTLAMAELEEENQRLARRVGEVRGAGKEPPPPDVMVGIAERLTNMWDRMTPAERQLTLRAAGVRQVRYVKPQQVRKRESLRGRVKVIFDDE